MNNADEIDSDYLAMTELTKEIGSLVEKSIDQRKDELSPADVEHIVKMTSDVIIKLKKRAVEITA